MRSHSALGALQVARLAPQATYWPGWLCRQRGWREGRGSESVGARGGWVSGPTRGWGWGAMGSDNQSTQPKRPKWRGMASNAVLLLVSFCLPFLFLLLMTHSWHLPDNHVSRRDSGFGGSGNTPRRSSRPMKPAKLHEATELLPAAAQPKQVRSGPTTVACDPPPPPLLWMREPTAATSAVLVAPAERAGSRCCRCRCPWTRTCRSRALPARWLSPSPRLWARCPGRLWSPSRGSSWAAAVLCGASPLAPCPASPSPPSTPPTSPAR